MVETASVIPAKAGYVFSGVPARRDSKAIGKVESRQGRDSDFNRFLDCARNDGGGCFLAKHVLRRGDISRQSKKSVFHNRNSLSADNEWAQPLTEVKWMANSRPVFLALWIFLIAFSSDLRNHDLGALRPWFLYFSSKAVSRSTTSGRFA